MLLNSHDFLRLHGRGCNRSSIELLFQDLRRRSMAYKLNRQSGQALITVAFGMVVMLGAAGLAVDMGYLRYERRLQQSAADSAALAGADAAGNGGSITFAAKQD